LIRSQIVQPGQSVHAATKAGIVQLLKTATAEFSKNGVSVNAIAPDIIETPLTAQISNNEPRYRAYEEKTALRRWVKTSEMARPAVFLASDSSSYITGTVLYVDGDWTAIDGASDHQAHNPV
jgi:NAD(P)-dependent dehydrogenase (short-subunit alcohol dehydrogenase family)